MGLEMRDPEEPVQKRPTLVPGPRPLGPVPPPDRPPLQIAIKLNCDICLEEIQFEGTSDELDNPGATRCQKCRLGALVAESEKREGF